MMVQNVQISVASPFSKATVLQQLNGDKCAYPVAAVVCVECLECSEERWHDSQKFAQLL